MKTKINLSAGLICAISYLVYISSGYVSLFLIAGYVLIAEENMWLKVNVLKVIILAISVSVLECLVGLVPDALGTISLLANIFKGQFNYSTITNITRFVLSGIAVFEKGLFLILALKASKQEDIKISFVDNIIEKYFINM